MPDKPLNIINYYKGQMIIVIDESSENFNRQGLIANVPNDIFLPLEIMLWNTDNNDVLDNPILLTRKQIKPKD